MPSALTGAEKARSTVWYPSLPRKILSSAYPNPSQQTCIGTLSTNTNTVQEYSMLKECLEDNNKYNKIKNKIKYFEKRKYNIFAVDLKKGYEHDPTKRKLSKEMDPFFMQKVKKMLNSLKFEIRLKEKGIKTNENNI